MVDRCALSCGMLAMRRGMLRRFRVVCLLFLFFFSPRAAHASAMLQTKTTTVLVLRILPLLLPTRQ
jgi:hypothetical protein